MGEMLGFLPVTRAAFLHTALLQQHCHDVKVIPHFEGKLQWN